MKDIWFISDTHWQHSNILKFTDESGNLIRPEFDSVEEMDEFMIQEWNKRVKKGDKVWHFGDVFFGNFETYRDNIHKRLNGRKRLLLGNHEDDTRVFGLFEKVQLIRNWTEHNFVASHIPMNNFSCYSHRKNMTLVNVHGHVHRNDVPQHGYVNISCEKTGYAPIHIEDVIQMVNKELVTWESFGHS